MSQFFLSMILSIAALTPLISFAGWNQQVALKIEFAMIANESLGSWNAPSLPSELTWKAYQGETLLIPSDMAVVRRMIIDLPPGTDFIVRENLGHECSSTRSYCEDTYRLEDAHLKKLEPESDRVSSYRLQSTGTPIILIRTLRGGNFPTISKIQVQLLSLPDYQWTRSLHYNFYAMILGLIGGMVIFNLGSMLISRRLYFFYFSAATLCGLYCFLFESRMIVASNITMLGLILASGLSFVFMIEFTFQMLRTDDSRGYLHRAGILVSAASVLCLLMVVAGFEKALPYSFSLQPIGFFICTWATIQASLKKSSHAVVMLLGNLSLTMAFVVLATTTIADDSPNMFPIVPIAVALETFAFSIAIALKTRSTEQKFISENRHAFTQMQKLIYPHQLTAIRQGQELESTMPTHPARACVLCFDLIASSQLAPEVAKDFFREVFAACNQLMMENYSSEPLRARAYRIKEMGDGFLCSVGYPFASVGPDLAAEAMDLCLRFLQAVEDRSRSFGLPPVYCSVGLAIDAISGFYPQVGTKEYDLFGRAIVLAKRYENMRKDLPINLEKNHIIIVQEAVYRDLTALQKNDFVGFELGPDGPLVRDDKAAKRLYYRLIHATPMAKAS